MDREERDAIRARADAATEGPWRIEELLGEGQERPAVCEVDGTWVFPERHFDSVDMQNTQEDATFIAHARSDIPALLDALDAMEAELDENEAALRVWRRRCEEAETERDAAVGMLRAYPGETGDVSLRSRCWRDDRVAFLASLDSKEEG